MEFGPDDLVMVGIRWLASLFLPIITSVAILGIIAFGRRRRPHFRYWPALFVCLVPVPLVCWVIQSAATSKLTYTLRYFQNLQWLGGSGVSWGETTPEKTLLKVWPPISLTRAKGLPPPRRVSSRVSGPPTAGGGLHRFQHRRANRAVAVSATNPNIKWHITLAAPRTRTQRPP